MQYKKHLLTSILALLAFVIVHLLSNVFYSRIDTTQDGRYTLSDASKKVINTIDAPIYIDVFLTGNMPSEFKRLQDETNYLLEEFSAINNHIIVNYINPKAENEDLNVLISEMEKFEMPALRVATKENGKTAQEVIFPWAVVNYKQKVAKVSLLKTNTNNASERINNSVQHLEYAFANAIKNLSTVQPKKIGILLGNKPLESKYVYDFLNTLSEHYQIVPFALNNVSKTPKETTKNLQQLDVLICAKPQKPFTDSEKYALDQYMVRGGKSVWLIDAVHAEMDSLSQHGKTLAIGKDLNLNDLFFQYGFRVNPVLVKDTYAADMMLLDAQQQPTKTPWVYSPLAIAKNTHPISTNISPVKFEFANTIDLVKQGIHIKKTPLLQTSSKTAIVGMPAIINLNEASNTVNLSQYTHQNSILAALLEGSFTSAFKNRVKPFKIDNHSDQDTAGKLVIIADGDVIKNQLDRGKPMALGYDKWTQQTHGNKEFLENVIDYLADDSGLIYVRNKKVNIPFLNFTRVAAEKKYWQLITIALPLGLLFLFGIGFTIIRKKKYC